VHPKKGTMGPDEFLELAERSGLLVMIEDWVLDNALQAGKRILDRAATPTKIAVNISSKQLFSNGFINKVKTTLQKHNFPSKNLEFEITENSVMGDLTGAKTILSEVKGLAIGLAIDDFGTGYSSLNHLAILPFDVLKISQTFTGMVEPTREHEAVFDGILTIASNLDIDIIAEGVETERQMAYLAGKGINIVQGYYFSKPLSEVELLSSSFV
jgi:EAL domain-containing protein (putative c-di-GMP-specific phosphodiesterase class I)